MPSIQIHQVDAFTDTLFGGNPAGVVPDANKLTAQQMHLIAREMNLSETAFVLQPSSVEANIRLRYFTPVSEVDFCGHATIGTLYELSRLGLHGLGKQGENSVRVETKAGILDMAITRKGQKISVQFTAPAVVLGKYPLQGSAFAEKMSIPTDCLTSNTSVFVDRTLNYIYVPITSLENLETLSFDFSQLRKEFAEEQFVVFCLYTNQAFTKQAHLHARVIGPFIGIPEDPFTGSTQAGMITAAKQNQMISKTLETILTEQGSVIDRPGSAKVQHDTVTDTFVISATATHVFSTSIDL